MNNLIIREKIATAQGIGIDFELLVKIQLFERCALPNEFEYLSKIVLGSEEGISDKIIEIEDQIENGGDVEYPSEFSSEFSRKWFEINPKLSNVDLRPYLYLSQDRSIDIAQGQELSNESLQIMAAIIGARSYMEPLKTQIQSLNPYDAKAILKKLIRNAKSAQFTKESLACCLNITRHFPDFSPDFTNFLKNLPSQKIVAPLVPTFKNESWITEVFDTWNKNPDVDQKVKNAIKQMGSK